MADKGKKNMEDFSIEELHEQIENDKKQAKRSTVFAMTALIAIIVLCIAWFVANNLVKGTTGGVSAKNSVPFDLASVGDRQIVEKNYLKDNNGNNILSEVSETKNYEKYIDISTGYTVTEDNTYYIGNSSLAWHLNRQQSLMPGASGKLEFYIIPREDNLQTVTLSLESIAYQSSDGRAVKSDDTTLQNLINGHILFFKSVDDTYGYQGWIQTNENFNVNAPGNGSFQKDVPYKMTIYWIWPQYLRNYVYTRKSTQGDLFTDATDQSTSSDYAKIIEFVNNQRTIGIGNNKLFYDSQNISIDGDINKNMLQSILDAASLYYNQADEYIGTKASYIYVGLKAN